MTILDALEVTREAIVEQLRDLEVPVPQAELPPLVRVEWGEKVWFERDQVRIVTNYARLHLGTEKQWGFNYDGDRAALRAEVSVDAEKLVRDALGETTGS